MWGSHVLYGTCITTFALMVFTLVVLRMTRLERFSLSDLSKTAYALLDNRCWLSDNVVTNNGLGMVRHPTESHSGVCVLRGLVPGSGLCDSSNSVLNDAEVVKSVGMEDVDGRLECVVRLLPTIKDTGAQAYSDGLMLGDITSSDVYASLLKKYNKLLVTKAGLQRDIVQSRADTDTANTNWRNQIVTDKASMANALSVQSSADDQALRDNVSRAADEKSRMVAQAQSDKDKAVASAQADRDRAVAKANLDNISSALEMQEDLGYRLTADCKVWLKSLTKYNCVTIVPPEAEPLACIPRSHQWIVTKGHMLDTYGSGENPQIEDSYRNDFKACTKRCYQVTDCTHFTFDSRQGNCKLHKGMPYAGGDTGFSSAISMDKHSWDSPSAWTGTD